MKQLLVSPQNEKGTYAVNPNKRLEFAKLHTLEDLIVSSSESLTRFHVLDLAVKIHCFM